MSDDKSSYPKNYPLILKRLLDTPQLLPHESSKEFLQLFASFEDYGKPQNPRSYLAAYQATVLTWEVLRYQHMKIGVLDSHELAAPWFKDPASRPPMMKAIENAGFPPNALEVEAFQLALPALATIERLIVSAQKRLDKFLEELERTAKANARALRVAAEKAIAANTSVQSPASTK